MSIFAAPAFYNQADQNIYSQGYSFVPQERFRGGAFNFPTTPTTTGAATGINTVPINRGGGGGEDNNPFNPNMNQIRTDFRPEYDFRRYSEYGMYPSTMDRKEMDMNQSYFYDTPSAMEQKISGLMNFIPGIGGLKRGAEFVGGILNKFMPVNQRAILENQLRGQGVLTDDIGRIVAGPGGYNTPEGIMAGYNASQMTGETFDKRTGSIENTLRDKYGFNDEDINNLNNGIVTSTMKQKGFNKTMGKTTNLLDNFININTAKQNFLTQQKKAAEIAAFKEAEKIRKESERQYDPDRHGSTNYGLGSDGQQSYSGDALGDKDQGFGINATTGGPVSNRTGRGRTDYMDGGLANLVDIYD